MCISIGDIYSCMLCDYLCKYLWHLLFVFLHCIFGSTPIYMRVYIVYRFIVNVVLIKEKKREV